MVFTWDDRVRRLGPLVDRVRRLGLLVDRAPMWSTGAPDMRLSMACGCPWRAAVHGGR
jgi:hypothetical protein